MSLSSIFMGVPQSRYAAIAILIAIVAVSLTIILGKDPIPVSQKFGFVLLVFLISLPSLAMSLFQLTCLVTGAGFKNQRWWCSIYAWVLSAMMIFYAVLLVVAAVMSLKSGKTITMGAEGFTDAAIEDANKKAKEKFEGAEGEEEPELLPEGFTSVAKAMVKDTFEGVAEEEDDEEKPEGFYGAAMPAKKNEGFNGAMPSKKKEGFYGAAHSPVVKKQEGFYGAAAEPAAKKHEGFYGAAPAKFAGGDQPKRYPVLGMGSLPADVADVNPMKLPPLASATPGVPAPSLPETFTSSYSAF